MFSLALSVPKKIVVFKIIKDIEYNIKDFLGDTKIDIRAHLFPLLDKYTNSRRTLTECERDLLKLNLTVKNFIKNNPDILFTKADKDNTIVAMDCATYHNKVLENLNDNIHFNLFNCS